LLPYFLLEIDMTFFLLTICYIENTVFVKINDEIDIFKNNNETVKKNLTFSDIYIYYR